MGLHFMIKQVLARYITENLNDLLALDLKIARLMGAPAPHTLSSYAYMLEVEGKPWGQFWRPIIDRIFRFIFDQKEHCKDDFIRVTQK